MFTRSFHSIKSLQETVSITEMFHAAKWADTLHDEKTDHKLVSCMSLNVIHPFPSQ